MVIWRTMTPADTSQVWNSWPPTDWCLPKLFRHPISFWSHCSQRDWRQDMGSWTLSPPTASFLLLGPLRTSSSMISSSWPVMKSNWLWLSSIINEADGSQTLQAIWQMASSIYHCACHSGSLLEWFMLWNLVTKGFVLRVISGFWHSLWLFLSLTIEEE